MVRTLLFASQYKIHQGHADGYTVGHLVEDDLLAAIDSGQLSGALLDVFTQEPLPEPVQGLPLPVERDLVRQGVEGAAQAAQISRAGAAFMVRAARFTTDPLMSPSLSSISPA